MRSGLISSVQHDGGYYLVLNQHHPGISALRSTLCSLTGRRSRVVSLGDISESAIDPAMPLAQRGRLDFHILSCLIDAGKPLALKPLERRLPDAWPCEVEISIERLKTAGILTGGRSGYKINERVPSAYVELVAVLAKEVYKLDPRVRNFATLSRGRPRSFETPEDKAPRLFGTDLRLRNLMALAKHGALHLKDLRRITGAPAIRVEGHHYAPFGRGGVVHVWETQNGAAAILHPRYPVAEPLRDLLLKLEEMYPLPPLVRRHQKPNAPETYPAWSGDKLALFGSPIPTTILLTIGALGWTFQALSVATATGYHLQNVRKAHRRLEAEGVLRGDRKFRSGFDVRAVYLSKEFAAYPELQNLLDACVKVWPQFARSAKSALSQLTPKTRAHLRNRGLL